MATFKEKIKERIPSRNELLPVFSLIIFIDFSWTLYRMFWQVPSWLYYMNFWGVLTLAAYALAFALLESTIILGCVLFLSLVFPVRHFRAKFVQQGSVVVLLLSVIAVALQRKIGLIYDQELEILLAFSLISLAGVCISIFIFSYIFEHFGIISRLIASFAERMVVFSYLYVPLSLVSLAIVLVRNLF